MKKCDYHLRSAPEFENKQGQFDIDRNYRWRVDTSSSESLPPRMGDTTSISISTFYIGGGVMYFRFYIEDKTLCFVLILRERGANIGNMMNGASQKRF